MAGSARLRHVQLSAGLQGNALDLNWFAAPTIGSPPMSNVAAWDAPSNQADPGLDVASMFAQREGERFDLHTRYMNEMMVRVLRTIGYDVGFCAGQGQYLYDRAGVRYLDLLSGWGVF